MTRRFRSDLILPAALAATAGLVALLAFGIGTVDHGDAVDYMTAAEAIVAGDPYPRDVPSRYFFRPPGYPAVIAAVWWLFGVSVAPLKFVNLVAFAVTVLLVAFIGSHVAEDRRVGLVAGILYALHPFVLRYVVDVQTEPLFSALVAAGVAGVYLAMSWSERPWIPALAGGIAFGAAALTRPSALGVALVLVLVVWAHRGLRRGLLTAAAFLLAVAVVIAPWTWSNWQATGDLIPVADGFGYHMWIGNHPDVLRLYGESFPSPADHDRFHYPHLLVDLPAAQIERWETAGIDYWGLSIGERDRLWRDDAVSRAADRPLVTIRLLGWKTWGLWQPWLRADYYPVSWVVASGAGILALYTLGALGGIALWRRSPRGRALILLLVAVFAASTAAHVITHVLLRFRVPYVDPYLTLMAAVALVMLGDRLRRRDRG